MDLQTIQAVADLEERVRLVTRQFHHSAVAAAVHDPALGHVFGEIPLTVADILLVGILGQTHVLVTGPTGCGKTDLVRLVCQGVFGEDGWHLLKLNPHLTEETFADIDTRAFQEKGLRSAISPAPFLSLPCTVLDECNRCPPALTNVLLGFCDGRIELKCGLKCEVGQSPRGAPDGSERYHLVIATMNEGREYEGTFGIDPALSRRLTLWVPFGDVRPTPHDIVQIVAERTGHARLEGWPAMFTSLALAGKAVRQLPLDPLALIYTVYLCNVGRCPHSPTGFHPSDSAGDLCSRTECRVRKAADGFCPSTGGIPEGVAIFLKRAACALAAIRGARTVRAIMQVCELGDGDEVDALRTFAMAPRACGDRLKNAAVEKYLGQLAVGVQDVRALVPFVGLGGKVWLADPYVAKHFGGSAWRALQQYARHTYANLEAFFRQNQPLFEALSSGDGAVDKLKARLEHAERFSDPAVRATIEPFLDKYGSTARGPDEVAEEVTAAATANQTAVQLLAGESP